MSGVGLENVFAGARTSSLSPAGGEFGLFYSAIDSSQEFPRPAFVLGLKADVNNRSNVAALHTGAEGSGPITLELQVLDGSEGGKAVGQPLSVTLNPGGWVQPREVLRERRTCRTATSESGERPGRPPGTPTASLTTAATPASGPATGRTCRW